MSQENSNEDFRPTGSDVLLEQSVQQANVALLFQQNEVVRLQNELNELKNMSINREYIPFIEPNNILSDGLNTTS